MDPTHLAPGSFEGPKKDMQIQDAKDFQQAVRRVAEKHGSTEPPYDFLELIGKGGTGRVYKCQTRSTGQIVAIKTINIDSVDYESHTLDKDDTLRSFQKEVATLQRLKDSHAPNVNLIHDAFDYHNQLWIVSDYCTGGSIRTLHRATPPPNKGLEEAYIRPIARELARAIKGVHDLDIIHRDIKCTNVYVTEEGGIQLGDFGVIGVIDDGGAKRKTVIGTPHYMSREMLNSDMHGSEGYGTEVDIWAYGCSLFEMAMGHPPYPTVNPDEISRLIHTLPPPRIEPGYYSPEFCDFTSFCLNVDPEERPKINDILQHPYIADTSETYPTQGLIGLIERYKLWEYKGGQRQSLFYAGGAAAPPKVGEMDSEDTDHSDDDNAHDWNFSTSDNFNIEFVKRYSQMVATQDFAAPPAGPSGLPPIITQSLTPFQELQQRHKELSADRGERSLGRLWNPEAAPYELHAPPDDYDDMNSDLPLRNTAPMRESLIDLDSADGSDALSSSITFDFSDMPTLKARTSHIAGREEEDFEHTRFASQDLGAEKRATMEWKFPMTEPPTRKRATMEWTFPAGDDDDDDTADSIDAADSSVDLDLPTPVDHKHSLPSFDFKPALKHAATEPIGFFGEGFSDTVRPHKMTASSPIRDSMASMIDLDMSLADSSEPTRPSTSSSATGSMMSDMTSGNPFDVDEPNRDRFSYHKQWRSDGGEMKRQSHKTMSMHSRGNSLTSNDTDSIHDSPTRRHRAMNQNGFQYEYTADAGYGSRGATPDHWGGGGGGFSSDDDLRYNIASTLRAPGGGSISGSSTMHSSPPTALSHHTDRSTPPQAPGVGRGPRGGRRAWDGRGPRPGSELEFPAALAAHPEALSEDANLHVVGNEMDRLMRDLEQSFGALGHAFSRRGGGGRGGKKGSLEVVDAAGHPPHNGLLTVDDENGF